MLRRFGVSVVTMESALMLLTGVAAGFVMEGACYDKIILSICGGAFDNGPLLAMHIRDGASIHESRCGL